MHLNLFFFSQALLVKIIFYSFVEFINDMFCDCTLAHRIKELNVESFRLICRHYVTASSHYETITHKHSIHVPTTPLSQDLEGFVTNKKNELLNCLWFWSRIFLKFFLPLNCRDRKISE